MDLKKVIGDMAESVPGIITFEAFKALVSGAMNKIGQKGAEEAVPMAKDWFRANYGLDAEDENLYLRALTAMEPNDATRLQKKLDLMVHTTDQSITDLRMNWFRIIILREDPADMVRVMTEIANMSDPDWIRMRRQMNLDREKAETAFSRIGTIITAERTRLGTELAAAPVRNRISEWRNRMAGANNDETW